MKRMTLTCTRELAEKLFIVFILSVTYSAFANELQFEGGNVNVSWNYLSASQEIEFEVKAKASGYVAMGLTKTKSDMQNLDLFAGGVDSLGNGYLKDYYATGTSTPSPDGKQNYTLISATEVNGVTTVRCKRKLDTQDNDDQVIQAGDQLYIAWAYHTSSDTLTIHSSRGYSSQMHVLVPVMTTTVAPTSSGTTSTDLTSETPSTNVATTKIETAASILTSLPTTSTTLSSSISTTTTTTTTSLIYSSASTSSLSTLSTQMTSTTTATDTTATDTTTSVESSQTITTSTITVFSSTKTNIQRQTTTIAPSTSQTMTPSTSVSPSTKPTTITYNNDRSYNNGDVLIQWQFNSNTNELFFKLVMKAAGWVGLGISNTNSDMIDMDVVVAGVSGGQGYIGDYYSKTKVEPPRDAKQNYTLRTATENGGKTTVEFKRKINTGDDKDLQIVRGKSYYLAWAYHSSSDSLSYHSQRGYSTEKVVLAAAANAVLPTSVMVFILSLICALQHSY